MTRIELQISGVGSNCSNNCASSTDKKVVFVKRAISSLFFIIYVCIEQLTLKLQISSVGSNRSFNCVCTIANKATFTKNGPFPSISFIIFCLYRTVDSKKLPVTRIQLQISGDGSDRCLNHCRQSCCGSCCLQREMAYIQKSLSRQLFIDKTKPQSRASNRKN